MKLNGALSIATTEGRWKELKRQATTAQLFDVNVEVLNIDQIKKIYPIINEKDICPINLVKDDKECVCGGDYLTVPHHYDWCPKGASNGKNKKDNLQ